MKGRAAASTLSVGWRDHPSSGLCSGVTNPFEATDINARVLSPACATIQCPPLSTCMDAVCKCNADTFVENGVCVKGTKLLQTSGRRCREPGFHFLFRPHLLAAQAFPSELNLQQDFDKDMSDTSSEIFNKTAQNITDAVGVQTQDLVRWSERVELPPWNYFYAALFFTLSCSSQKYSKETTPTRHLWSLNSSKKVILDHFLAHKLFFLWTRGLVLLQECEPSGSKRHLCKELLVGVGGGSSSSWAQVSQKRCSRLLCATPVSCFKTTVLFDSAGRPPFGPL